MVAVNRSRPLPSHPVNLFDASVQILDNLIGRTIAAHIVSPVAYVPDAGILVGLFVVYRVTRKQPHAMVEHGTD